jgi:hypothetical protein
MSLASSCHEYRFSKWNYSIHSICLSLLSISCHSKTESDVIKTWDSFGAIDMKQFSILHRAEWSEASSQNDLNKSSCKLERRFPIVQIPVIAIKHFNVYMLEQLNVRKISDTFSIWHDFISTNYNKKVWFKINSSLKENRSELETFVAFLKSLSPAYFIYH